jgi:hypothetical protein
LPADLAVEKLNPLSKIAFVDPFADDPPEYWNQLEAALREDLGSEMKS